MARHGDTRTLPALDYLQRNQDARDLKAAEYAESGRLNRGEEPHWDIWEIPETELHLLPDLID